ncbi:MAG: T9SS type A sorting domain-containing protein [bacterium]|nr:T9SS type A sorting domain-containing protein [bacterium]
MSRYSGLLSRLICCVLLLTAAIGVSAAEHHALVRFWIDSEADQAYIDTNHNDLDIATGRRGEYYDLIVLQNELSSFMAKTGRREVLQRDLENHYADRLGSREGFGDYHTLSEAIAWWDELHAMYPDVIGARWSIGQSHQGNDIWCFRVSDNPDVDEEGEPEVLFDGLHHAREIMAAEVSSMLAEYLAEQYYAGDPEIVALLDNFEIYMVPIVNPDGFLYNEQTDPNGGGMWRKNRRNNGDGTMGVDPNRNYPYEWGCTGGSSGDTSSETYRGPSPGSEPEVQTMMAFINDHEFVTRQSWHTYSNLTLLPWAYTTAPTPDHALFHEMGAVMTQYNGYTYGQPGVILYEVCGGNGDWDYGAQDEHLKIFSFCNEIGSNSDGFWPSNSRRQALFEENIWPALYMIQMSAPLRGVSWSHEPHPFLASSTTNITIVGTPAGFDGAAIETSSVLMHYRLNGGTFTQVAMLAIGGGEYAATIPAQAQGTVVEYYLVAADVDGHTGTAPFLAPASSYYLEIGESFDHEMEADRGWVGGDSGDTASTGIWVRVDPRGTDAQPENDHTAAGTDCWVTGQGSVGGSLGENDVDSGFTSLLSPVYDMTGATELNFSFWSTYSNDTGSTPNTDWWDIYLSNDGGETWTNIFHSMDNSPAWTADSFNLFDYFPTAGLVQVKFVAADEGEGSIVEAAVDDFSITGLFDQTGIEDFPGAFEVTLAKNFPNPFNPKTTIRFTLNEAERVNLSIFDTRGRLVRHLLLQEMPAGEHAVSWNGTDVMGRPAVSGVYFARLQAGGVELNQRMVMLK